MKKQCCNPYLPSWEYIPDGEPYVFGDRVYIYGSHDRFGGYAYCLNDYVCWSAPADDLSDWKYEGIIYKRTQDPANEDGEMCLYAPDVVQGEDGRYYLYYVLDQMKVVSVAVCDSPAGNYEFYGYVHYMDGVRLGEGASDQPQFDPGVLMEDGKVYLYTGFCKKDDIYCKGAMAAVLDADMLTVREAPVIIAPSKPYSAGSGYEGHEYFEAASIRKVRGNYYFIYSSVVNHELCYAVSDKPTQGFRYQGVIVSNNDTGIDSYKPALKAMYYGGNNHGSIIEILGKWYVFYHRHTDGTNFSRQGCIEPIQIEETGRIIQVEMTSCGASGIPFEGRGKYPAYLACNLFCSVPADYTAIPGEWMDCRFPKITQDGKDGEETPGYIANMRDGAVAGFKYFNCKGVCGISVEVRGGRRGCVEVMTSWDGEVLGKIPVTYSNEWKTYSAAISIPDGVQALYFRYCGEKAVSLGTFTLNTEETV